MRIKATLYQTWYANLLLKMIEDYAPEVVIGNIEEPDCFMVPSSTWVNMRRHGTDMTKWLHELTKDNMPVIGVDDCDVPSSKFTPDDVDHFDLVLKAQCLPRDREEMNYEIGVRYGLNRTRTAKDVDKEFRLSSAQLDKFQLSFDLGMKVVSNVPRYHAVPAIEEWEELGPASFVGCMNSVNRERGLRKILAAGGEGFLTRLPIDHPITGIHPSVAKDYPHYKLKDLYKNRIPPMEFEKMCLRNRVVAAFSGIGELSDRHYQASAYGRALWCEYLDHLETIFPFNVEVNYAQSPEDMNARYESRLWRDSFETHRIAVRARNDFVKTYTDMGELFHKHFLRPVQNLL